MKFGNMDLDYIVFLINLAILQIPGVPIMYITQHQYSIERLPEATMGGGMCQILSRVNITSYSLCSSGFF